MRNLGLVIVRKKECVLRASDKMASDGCPVGPASKHLDGAVVRGTDGRMYRATFVGKGFAQASSSKRRKSSQSISFWELVDLPSVKPGHTSLQSLSDIPVKKTHRGCRLILDEKSPTGCEWATESNRRLLAQFLVTPCDALDEFLTRTLHVARQGSVPQPSVRSG